MQLLESSLILILINKISRVLKEAEKLLTCLTTKDDFVILDHASHVLSHLHALLILSLRVKIGCLIGFSLGLCQYALRLEFSCIKTNLGLDLKSFFLSICLSKSSLLVGLRFCENLFSLLFSAGFSLGLDSLSLNSLYRKAFLCFDYLGSLISLCIHLNFFKTNFLHCQLMNKIIHFLLIFPFQGQHSFVIFIHHSDDCIF